MDKLDTKSDNVEEDKRDDTTLDETDDTKHIVETPSIAEGEDDEERESVDIPPSISAKKSKLGWLKKAFRSRKVQIAAPIILVVLIAVAVFVNPVKYTLLNLVTSGQAKFVLVDDTTLAPITDATVTMSGQTGKTDKNGKLTLKKLNFGDQTYTIRKESYTTKKGSSTVKPGSNLVGPVKIHSDGFPVEIHAVNKLSGENTKDFVVGVAGTAISAHSDKGGMAILKLPSNHLGKQSLTISATGFNKLVQQTTITEGQKQAPLTVSITPEGKHFFLSNRDGKISVYSANLDGSDIAAVITGSSSDDAETTLTSSPDGKYGALVSKRESQHDASGQVVPALYSIDYNAKTIKRIDEGAPNFNASGWMDNTHLVYTVSYNDSQKTDNVKIKTADITNGKLATIATFPSYPSIQFFPEEPHYVYVSLSDQSKPDYGIFAYNLTTKAKQQIDSNYTYNFVQTKPHYVSYQLPTDSTWHELNLKTQKAQASAAVDASQARYYSVSPNGQKTAWIEIRDGKGAVIVGNQDGVNSQQSTRNVTASSIIGWQSDDYVVFNSTTSDQAADYIVSLKTGLVTKISNVYVANYGR